MPLIDDSRSSAYTLSLAPPSSDPNPVTGAAGEKAVLDLVVLGQVPLPLIPLYDLNTAAALVPMTPKSIRWHLNTHKQYFNPPIYRKCPGGRKLRMITAYEIRTLRERVLRGPGVKYALSLYPNPNVTPAGVEATAR